MPRYSKIFESRSITKTYFAVAEGIAPADEWVCRAPIAPDAATPGRMRVDSREGREAETRFIVENRSGPLVLVKALPLTGRTHQIRLHLAESGLKIIGDTLYGGSKPRTGPFPMALRAAALEYVDPFTGRRVAITAPMEAFFRQFRICSVRG